MAPPPLLPITRLVLCPACDAHVKRGEVLCPHCGAAVDGRGGMATMAGLAMAGLLSSCIVAEPAYGVVVATESGTSSGSESASEGGTDGEGTTTEGPGTGTDSQGTTTDTPTGTGETTGGGESDYGVPTTDEGTGTGTTTGTTTGTETGTETGTTGAESSTGIDSNGEADYGVASTL